MNKYKNLKDTFYNLILEKSMELKFDNKSLFLELSSNFDKLILWSSVEYPNNKNNIELSKILSSRKKTKNSCYISKYQFAIDSSLQQILVSTRVGFSKLSPQDLEKTLKEFFDTVNSLKTKLF